MISIPPSAHVYVAIAPIDFRNGINGLGRICRDQMKQDPMNGAVFVFCSKKKTSLKLLYYDGNAFWLMIRRLSRGRLKWWPSANKIDPRELQLLLMDGNPKDAEFSDDWKKLIK